MKIWQALADWVCGRRPDDHYTETGAAGPSLPVPAAAEVFERRSRLAKPHLLGLSGWIAPGIRAWLVFSAFTPGVELELAALADLSFDAVELDLRDYFGRQQRLRRELAGVSMAWLPGGNVFMLRDAALPQRWRRCAW